jgi:ribosome maturation factor RimP
MDIKSKIATIAEGLITDPQYFLVEVVVTGHATKLKIRVLVDGDQGVDIDYCAKLSRGIANIIEEEQLIDDAYILEVSSPGIDYPLQNVRQYQKNIGRSIKVTPIEGKERKGVLKEVAQDAILLLEEIKEKGKKNVEEEVKIPFTEINKTQVLVSFK